MKSSDHLQAVRPPHGGVGPGLGEAAEGDVFALSRADVGGQGGDDGLHARQQIDLVEELARPKVRPWAGQVGVHQYDRGAERPDKLHEALQAAVAEPGVVVERQDDVRPGAARLLRLRQGLQFLVERPVQENLLGYDRKPIEW